MNYSNYLCCPKCKADLENSEKELFCHNCKNSYEINQGIPILVDMKNLPSHLSGQIRYFQKEDLIKDDNYQLAPWQKSYLIRFKNSFKDANDLTIIDCGAGSGYMAIELAKLGANVIACDLTLKGLLRIGKIAEKNGIKEKIMPVCCSAEELPFKESMFDLFVSNAVLEHLPREKEAISEINRVCKEKAGLMVAVPLKYKFLNPLLIPINWIHDKRIGHLRRYDKKTLEEKFPKWKLMEVFYTGHFKKVLKVLFNIIFKVFNEEEIEKEDRKKDTIEKGASNIICFLNKL